MELIQEAREGQKKTRTEFDATLKVALALAHQLREKLLHWGKRMEEQRAKESH
jgi:hypothetical protein